MFYKKQGLPEESEIVICTVKKVLFHSVFVTLDEYDKLEGMIHISEVSPGRIRNIRDFVKEDKKIICKVLRVNQEKKHVDLSLRRVSITLRKKKNEEYKQEQKAEKVLELFAQKQKTTLEQIYNEFGYKITEEFGTLNLCFQSVVNNETDLKGIVPEKFRKQFIDLIKEKVRAPEVVVEGILTLKSLAPNGIEIIKECIKELKELAKKKSYVLNISYLGAPHYKLNLVSSDYKKAELILKEVVETITNFMEKNKGIVEFKR